MPPPVEPTAASAPRRTRLSTPGVAALAASCRIPERFAAAFQAASSETGLPLALLSAVAWEESRMNPHAVSEAGAEGLLQVMPATAATVAVAENGPRANVLAGARYLLQVLDRFGELELALACVQRRADRRRQGRRGADDRDAPLRREQTRRAPRRSPAADRASLVWHDPGR